MDWTDRSLVGSFCVVAFLYSDVGHPQRLQTEPYRLNRGFSKLSFRREEVLLGIAVKAYQHALLERREGSRLTDQYSLEFSSLISDLGFRQNAWPIRR